MAFKLLDRVQFAVSGTPGTGNITVGSPTSGYQSPSQGGVSNGDTFPYLAIDGTAWEFGIATYSSTGPKIARTVTKCSSGSILTLTSAAIVTATLRAEDLLPFGVTSPADDDLLTFNSGTSQWQNTKAIVPAYTPPTVASLSAVTNLDGGVLVDNIAGEGIQGLYVNPATGQVNAVLYCALQAVPGSTFSAVTKIRRSMIPSSGGWRGSGIVVRDDVANKNMYMFINCGLELYFIFADGGYSATSTNDMGLMNTDEVFYHVDCDGTTVKFGVSPDGYHNNVIWPETLSGWGTPTHVGIGWSGVYAAGTGPFHLFEHFFAGALGSNGIGYH